MFFRTNFNKEYDVRHEFILMADGTVDVRVPYQGFCVSAYLMRGVLDRFKERIQKTHIMLVASMNRDGMQMIISKKTPISEEEVIKILSEIAEEITAEALVR